MGTDIETFLYGAVCVNMERIYKYMEENTNIVDNTETEVKDNTTDSKAGEGATATFTQEDVDKKVQSECDKLRTKYVKEIKDLQEQIKKLSPVEKSESEIAIENRLAELEKAQEEVNAQKAFLSLQDTLQGKGIDKSLATYLKADVDVDAFVAAFNNAMKEVTKTTGYVPDSHNAGDKITAEEFRNWSYDQKAELYTKNPTLYQKLVKQLR
jgi:phenylalanyl-tRNA synthetase alpha subunit